MAPGDNSDRVAAGRPTVGRRGRALPTVLTALWLGVAALVGAAPAEAQPAPAPPAASDAEIDDLLATLEDAAARDRLIAQLRVLKAARAAAAGPELERETLGTRLLAVLSERVERTSAGLAAVAELALQLPKVARWVVDQAGDPLVRARWIEILGKIGLVLGVAILAEWLTMRLLTRVRRAVEGATTERLWMRLPLLLLRTVIDIVPIAAFAAAGYVVLPFTEPRDITRLVALTIINASVIARAVVAVARTVLVPKATTLRVLPIGDETAYYLFIWLRRLATVTIYGYFLLEAALLVELPFAAYEFFQRVLGLLVAGLLIVLVLQNRAALAAWLRGPAVGGALAGLRQRLADVWHVLAILYILAVFAVWALDIAGGFQFLLRATALSAVIALASWTVLVGLRRAFERGFALGPELRLRFPGLEARVNRYLPLLRGLLQAFVYLMAGLVLLEAWGLQTLDWLASDLGRRLTGGALTIAVMLAVAVLLSELAGALIERYLERRDGAGEVVARSGRARTLLPLLRNALRLVLGVIVVLVALSEIGVDIGPLLAAAGVVGLAVGFGAQTLVKDVITGIFILAEDSIAVGDVVEVGGHAGLVEGMTIRTIRLRDLAGSVHTVPFSEATTVKNLTKDFSYALMDIGVAYREDVDAVIATLKEISAGMQADEAFGPEILEPMEVLGLDSFGDSAVVIKARIKTRPVKQWMVMREFNRRMKRVFDEKGIEIPFPHQTIYFGEDKAGRAPPLRARVEPPPPGEERG